MRVNKEELLKRLRARPVVKEETKTVLGFLAKPWFILAWPVISFLLLDSLSFVNNIKGLQAEWQTSKPKIYESNDWTGIWQAIPEGYVDSEDLGIDWEAPEDPILEIVAEGADFGGSIHTKGLCRFPFWGTAQLRGSLPLFGNTTEAVVWEIVGGKKVELAVLKLTRTGVAMEVALVKGSASQFYPNSKLWLAPGLTPYEDVRQAKQDKEWCIKEKNELGKLLEGIFSNDNVGHESSPETKLPVD